MALWGVAPRWDQTLAFSRCVGPAILWLFSRAAGRSGTWDQALYGQVPGPTPLAERDDEDEEVRQDFEGPRWPTSGFTSRSATSWQRPPQAGRLAARGATSGEDVPLVQRALRPRQRGLRRREMLGLVGTTFRVDPAARQDAKRRRSKYLQTRKVPTAETRSATTDLPTPDRKSRRPSRYVTASVTRRNLSKRHAPGDNLIRWNGVATLATIVPVTMP